MAVRFEVGPVDAAAARVWVTNSQRVVAAIRRHPECVPFLVEDALLDLVDIYLRVWEDVAHDGPTFHWTSHVDVEGVEKIAQQWRLIAGLGDDSLDTLGVSWAPPEAAAFYEAVLAGVVEALRQDDRTRPLAEELATRPPGTPTS